MKVPVELAPKTAKMNLTPMIDVVFLLIIFFVVSNTMMERDISMPLDLPAAAGESAKNETIRKKITINIDQEGNLFFGSAPVSAEELKAALLKERSAVKTNLEVRLRADRSVPYAVMEPVLVLCAESGIADLSFAVIDPE